MAQSGDGTSAQWKYTQTWMREDGSDEDAAEITKHLGAAAEDGWELVSANAVQLLFILTRDSVRPGFPPEPYSTGVVRHYYYWRKPADNSERRDRQPGPAMKVGTAEWIALGLAGGSLAISAWAAFTAHAARRWQQRRDDESRATHVTVDFVHASGPASGPLFAWSDRPMPERPTAYSLTVEVTNDGEATEYVNAAFVKQASGDHGLRVYGSEDGSEGEGPYELKPRATQQIVVELTPDDVAMLADGFSAEVWLGSGQRVHSAHDELLPELLADLG